MGQRPLPGKPLPNLVSPLWFSFDRREEDRELESLEQEVFAEIERNEQSHWNTTPVGKTENESHADDDELEEDDDGVSDDSDESESNSLDDAVDDEAEEIGVNVEEQQPDSPTS